MAFSIDGKRYKSELTIRYGEEFPKVYENREVTVEGIGYCNIYIVKLGRPYWTKKLTVRIPVSFYITSVIEPDEKYLKKSHVNIRINRPKRSHLRLVK